MTVLSKNFKPEEMCKSDIIGEAFKNVKDKPFFEFAIDLKFWALIPNFNLNFHTNTFEVEFLCFALYIRE